MDEQELFDSLIRCLPPQLTAITVKLALDPAYLPGPNASLAERANAILELARQRGPDGLVALEKALKEAAGPRTAAQAPRAASRAKARCVLILAANPFDTDRLRLDREVKLIEERLDEAEPGRSYKIVTAWAPTSIDLSKYLLKHEPTIVHFSGHGSPAGEIILEGVNGKAEAVPAQALVKLFDTLKGTELIVLNACYSHVQAEALATVVPHVIGMAQGIGDDSALRFAGGFYRGLAFGKDYATAFRLGCVEMDLSALPDALVPHFTTRSEDKVGTPSQAGGTGFRPSETPTEARVDLQRPQRTWRREDPAAPPPRLCKLWYGTNRRRVDAANPMRGYTGERDEIVHYGLCEVAVPKSHKIGSLGSSWWQRLITWDDDRLKLVNVSALPAADFWQSARAALAEWEPGERRALVFIHGFNVGFEEAALRTAQIATDLQVPGIPAFYSWPSKGAGVKSYEADAASIEASEGNITEFLTRFAADTGAERVDILAHSMGNRGLLRSMQRIMQQAAGTGKVPFGQILLAAPDIDAALFCDLANMYPQLSQHTTLYVSSKDKALAASGIVHDHPRAGYAPPVTVVPGVDTVEVSNIDLTFLGHGYYGAARDVLHDMHALIMNGAPPKARMGLRLTTTPEGQSYWQIGA